MTEIHPDFIFRIITFIFSTLMVAVPFLVFLALSFFAFLAPIFVWRNTNRMNRLVAILLEKQGISDNEIQMAWKKGRGKLPKI